jgi:hypothetical protein
MGYDMVRYALLEKIGQSLTRETGAPAAASGAAS